ncbi:MAG: hypothetical protein HC895_10520 [Leptolyngbyaceae cyanobacterium SM1_3_5]|nr:hypothetical protein [Leptolyngbyaceae cyanobacterium SM1_3_5]
MQDIHRCDAYRILNQCKRFSILKECKEKKEINPQRGVRKMRATQELIHSNSQVTARSQSAPGTVANATSIRNLVKKSISFGSSL